MQGKCSVLDDLLIGVTTENNAKTKKHTDKKKTKKKNNKTNKNKQANKQTRNKTKRKKTKQNKTKQTNKKPKQTNNNNKAKKHTLTAKQTKSTKEREKKADSRPLDGLVVGRPRRVQSIGKPALLSAVRLTSELHIVTHVAVLLDAWRCWVSRRTCRPGAGLL